MYTNQLTNEVHFFDNFLGWGSASLPKYAPLQVFNKILCTFVAIYKEFPKVLRTYVSQKIF